MMHHLLCRAAAVVALLALSVPARAHPVPKDNHDRTVLVYLTPAGVIVDYRLEVDGLTAALELRKEQVALPPATDNEQLARAYLATRTTWLTDNLVVMLDGKDIPLRPVRQSYRILDHLRCEYRFRGDWRAAAGEPHRFALRDLTYLEDNVSRLGVRLTADARVRLNAVEAPSEALLARPSDLRRPGDSERLRHVSATFTVLEREPAAVGKLALPPDLPLDTDSSDVNGVGRGGSGDAARAVVKPAADVPASTGKYAWDHEPDGEPPGESAPSGADAPGSPTPGSPAAGKPRTLLDLMLDTRTGLAALLLLAAGFGAVHALTPGHGKTMVAAYLVGERGTVWHAILLGIVTTLTHTAAVLVLAALLPLFFSDTSAASVQMVLEFLGGLLIAGLGLWLLLRRLAGQADHVHLGGGHGHHHHDHSPGQAAVEPVGWWALVVLGISGGIVPCWDAIAMLGLAISSQRLWLGLPLLLAFSAGLASVLVALGIGVVTARKYAGRKWGNEERFRKLVRVLPLLSAVLILAMGLWLCYDGIHGGH